MTKSPFLRLNHIVLGLGFLLLATAILLPFKYVPAFQGKLGQNAFFTDRMLILNSPLEFPGTAVGVIINANGDSSGFTKLSVNGAGDTIIAPAAKLDAAKGPDGQVKSTLLRIEDLGAYRIRFLDKSGATLELMSVCVIPRGYFFIALAGIALIMIALPYALGLGEGLKDAAGRDVSPWYALLSEPSGGYSLAHLQLLIWFLPVLALYAALSAVEHRFAPMEGTVAVLLGLGGATAMLGRAASPNKDGSSQSNPLPMPRIGDAVRDWSNTGDISRYQYLLLSLSGAAILVGTFFNEFRFVEIPQNLLLGLGASQATYLGTKAVKTGQNASDGAGGNPSAKADAFRIEKA
jgi:hypothetical protein